jgi:hypothetical protein
MPELASSPEIQRYLEGRSGFDEAFEIEGIIYVRGLGAGGDMLSVWSPGKSRLAKLMESAAHLVGMGTERVEAAPDMNVFLLIGRERSY